MISHGLHKVTAFGLQSEQKTTAGLGGGSHSLHFFGSGKDELETAAELDDVPG